MISNVSKKSEPKGGQMIDIKVNSVRIYVNQFNQIPSHIIKKNVFYGSLNEIYVPSGSRPKKLLPHL